MYVVLFSSAPGTATLIPLDDNGLEDPDEPAQYLVADDLVEAVEALELENPRWVWADTASQYGWLLSQGVRVDRCHDLRLTRAILRSSALSVNTRLATSPVGEWDAAAPHTALGNRDDDQGEAAGGPLPFDFEAPAGGGSTLRPADRASSPNAPSIGARGDAPGVGARGGSAGGEASGRSATGAHSPDASSRNAAGSDAVADSAAVADAVADSAAAAAAVADSVADSAAYSAADSAAAAAAYSAADSAAAAAAYSGFDTGVDADDAATATVAELALQLDAIRTSTEPNRLRLLIAAESAGALVAAEMSHAGLPWREDLHDELLTELLGPQVAPGRRPERLERLVSTIRGALDAPLLNPDSPQELLRALRGAGLAVTTTRSWELQGIEHPVIPPLLEYKKLSRLLTANGWSWMASWVTNGRFSPDYVPGGVVSGRWATRGGGALQLPKQVRRAVTADAGWKLVVADAAQLEPRILAGISADTAMAAAARGADLYAGIVQSGAVETRAQAKVAMLGAMYGATSGESGRLLPRLNRSFPTALSYVENAARAGERGEVVTSRLGRSAPRPGEQWWETQALAAEGAPDERAQQQARRESRDWGRFTRNFVVQASAADWALCWLADLRRRLAALAPPPAPASDVYLDAEDARDSYLAGTDVADTDLADTDLADSDLADTDPAGTDLADADLDLAFSDLADVTAAAIPGAPEHAAPTSAIRDTSAPTSGDVPANPPTADLSPEDREAARIAAIEAEIAERERRKAADSPFKAADPVAAMAERLMELRSAGKSVRPVAPTQAADRTFAAASASAFASASASAFASASAATRGAPGASPAPTANTHLARATPAQVSMATGAGYTATSGSRPSDADSNPTSTDTTAPAASGHAAAGADGDAIVAGLAAAPFSLAPHLVFFLHDEVIVHAPAALADEVADAVRASAAAATRLLFGQFPLDVPLDISIVDSYADAD